MPWVRLRAFLLSSLAALALPVCKPSASSSPAGADECAADLAASRDLLAAGSTLILGEVHGTREVPAFAGDLVCHGLAQGRSLVLALEIPITEQTRIDHFLASSGDKTAVTQLVSSDYWTFPMQDGRRSQAMVDLLARVRRWKQEGFPIEVVAFDAEVSPSEREAAMAAQLAAARRRRPDAVFLVVTGDLHAMRTPTPDFQPMAARFQSLVGPSRVLSLRMVHAGGSAWICTEECGPHQLESQRHVARSVNLFEDARGGFDGEFSVGSLHASPPAVQSPPGV